MLVVVYTKDNCPACLKLKAELKAAGEDFLEVNVGRDITREEFLAKFPGVRSMPHLVIGKMP